jgi:CHAD domain-containing protein
MPCDLGVGLKQVSKNWATSARSSLVLVVYLRTQVDELRAGEPGARIGSPEPVHQMTVASRRPRSTMARFGPVLTGPQAKRLRDELL